MSAMLYLCSEIVGTNGMDMLDEQLQDYSYSVEYLSASVINHHSSSVLDCYSVLSKLHSHGKDQLQPCMKLGMPVRKVRLLL